MFTRQFVVKFRTLHIKKVDAGRKTKWQNNGRAHRVLGCLIELADDMLWK